MTYKRWQGPTRPASNGAKVVRLELVSDEDAPGHARSAFAPLRGHADEDALERALFLTPDFVTNPARHRGGAEARVAIWPAGESIAVVVTDDGPGFTPVAQATSLNSSHTLIRMPSSA